MSEEDKFDEIIRSRFSEKEFLFDEENWEKAEAMLDKKKRRRAAFKWSLIFLFGLFTGIAGMLPFIGNKNEKSGNEMAELTRKEKADNEITEPGNAKNENLKPKENEKTVAQPLTQGQDRKDKEINKGN